jgi:hypothetical protein
MNYFEIPAISNSSLSILNYDPSYYYKVYISKEIEDKKESPALTLGSLVHCLMLEPDKISERYVISKLKPEEKPSGMMLDFINALLKYDVYDDIVVEAAYNTSGYKISIDKVIENFKKPANQIYYQEQLEAKGKSLITQADFNLATKAVQVALNNPQWEKILNNDDWEVHNEVEILWTWKPDIFCKSKVDQIRVRKVGNTLFVKYFDIKTDSQKPVHKYMETFMFWKTYRQLAFYREAILSWLDEHYGPLKDIETLVISPYIVAIDVVRLKSLIYYIDYSFIQKGYQEIRQDLTALVWHIENHLWEYPKAIYDILETSGCPVLSDETTLTSSLTTLKQAEIL